jgi:hypothetical protein
MVQKLDLLESARTAIRRPELAIMDYRDAESPGSIPVFIDRRRWLDEPASTASITVLKKNNLM